MNTIIKYIVFVSSSIVAYFGPIALLVHVVAILFLADLFTGIGASLKEGESLKSSKARWSFVKMAVYLIALSLVFSVCERMEISEDTILSVAKIIVWMIIYVEGLSVIENLKRILPKNKVMEFLHYLLSVEFLKIVPYISDFLKEDKDKLNHDKKDTELDNGSNEDE